MDSRKSVILYLLLCIAVMCQPIIARDEPYIGRCHELAGIAAQLGRSHVSNIQQDSDGFIWFATWNGLVRYDGYSAYTFKPISCSDGTIDSDRIYNIKLSRSGDIWCVSSDNRLFSFSPTDMSFRNLSSAVPDFNGRKVKTLTPLKNGYTWVSFRDGSYARINDSSPLSDVRLYQRPDELVPGAASITAITLTEDDNEWVLTDAGVLNYDSGKIIPGVFKYAEHLHDKTYLIAADGKIVRLSDGYIYDSPLPAGDKVNYVRTDNHRVLIASGSGTMSVDVRDGSVLKYSAFPATYLYKDSQHRVWSFGPQNGVVLVTNLGVESSRRLLPQTISNKQPIKNPQLIFETPEDDVVLWCPGGVLSVYDEREDKLSDVRFDGMPGGVYAPDEVKKFIVDRACNLWVLHAEGPDCITVHKRAFSHEVNRSGSETRAMTVDSHDRLWTAERSGLVSCRDFSIYVPSPAYVLTEDTDGRIWIGTKGDGVYLLTPSTPHATDYTAEHLSREGDKGKRIHSDSIYSIAFDGPRVWLGAYGGGLGYVEPSVDGWTSHYVAGQPTGMKIRDILPDGKGHLLIATADGLVVSDAPSNPRPHFYINRYRKDERGLRGNDIMKVTECRGRYYLSVFGGGLSRIDSENLMSDSLLFTTFQYPHAAESGQISTSIGDGENIWTATGNAITCFSVPNESMRTILCDIPSGQLAFSEAAPVISDSAHIVFGTKNGILTFNRRLSESDIVHCQMVVTGIMYQNDNKAIPLYNPHRILITPDRRSFTLYLSMMDYHGGSPVHLRYRMEGLDEGWNYQYTSLPSVTYNNTAPGVYRLIMEVEGNNGCWLPTSSVEICVEPTFTETWIFRFIILALLGLLFIGLIVAIIYFMRMRDALQRKYSLLMTIGKVRDRLNDEDSRNRKTISSLKDDDSLFIEASLKFLDNNIDNAELVVEDFARHLGMSRTAYYNRMKEVYGVSPVDFIRQMRINRALKYLENDNYTISEVAYMVGFTDPKYFSRCFKAEMNMTPSQYKTSLSKTDIADNREE